MTGSGDVCVVTETVGTDEGNGGMGGTVGKTAGPPAESKAAGRPNMTGGLVRPDFVLQVLLALLPLFRLSVYLEEALEARLISLARV